MNILEWLLQTTSKGATYLQAITLTLLAVFVIIVSIREFKSLLYECTKEKKK